jgi:hypothetical protein
VGGFHSDPGGSIGGIVTFSMNQVFPPSVVIGFVAVICPVFTNLVPS